jgi:UDP-N-acetylglucosamine transferase subunit ALG13
MEKLAGMEGVEARGFTKFYSVREGPIEHAYKIIVSKSETGSIIKARTKYPLVVGTQKL